LRELSLHLLDIAENSIAANASEIQISVVEDTVTDLLQMSVQDNGKGMDAETVAHVIDPFFTSRTTRKVGLGIPLLKEAAEACNGFLKLDSEPGKGTRLFVQFQRSNIDRMPLGNLADTYIQILVMNPQIHWLLQYKVDDREYLLDSKEISEALDGVPMTEPAVLSAIREMVETGIGQVTDQGSG
jgi:hypothetical protein